MTLALLVEVKVDSRSGQALEGIGDVNRVSREDLGTQQNETAVEKFSFSGMFVVVR